MSLPQGWTMACLPDLVAVAGVFTDGDWVESKDQDPNGDVRLTQLADVGDGIFRDRSSRFLTSESAAELRCTFLQAGDVLVARMPDPLGRACIFPGDKRPCVTVVDVCVVRPDVEEIDNRWLMHFVNSPDFRAAVAALQSGSTRKRISRKNLAKIEFPVPPAREQRRIVEEVESCLTRLDDAVATLERVQANLKRYRASILKAAVEGRLVPTEAEVARAEGRDYEPASVLLEGVEPPPRPSRYRSRSQDVIDGHASLSVGDPKTPLPEGWARTALVDVARLESGHTPSRKHPEWWGGDVPWMGIKDARAHHGGEINATLQTTNEDGLANSAARLLPAGTVCLSRTASVGYVVVLGRPMATSQDFVNWICTEAVHPAWLRCVFMADPDALRRFGKGTTHTTIYYPEVLSMHVALPPLQEQVRIAERVDELLSQAEADENVITVAISRLARLRHSTLKWAFEGRLVDQDPDDEPASVLLERIKAEQDAARPKKRTRRTRKAKS